MMLHTWWQLFDRLVLFISITQKLSLIAPLFFYLDIASFLFVLLTSGRETKHPDWFRSLYSLSKSRSRNICWCLAYNCIGVGPTYLPSLVSASSHPRWFNL
jgi:hypothetical protein